MEKTKGIKAYDEYKTNMRAVVDGVNLLGRHAWMLLKACLPLMVMLSLLWGWAAFCLVNDMNQLVTTDITVTGVPHSFFLPFALLSLVKIVALAQFYSLFQGYVRHGFIPQVNYRSIWVQTGKTLKGNTLIVWLWMAFVVGIFFALAYFLMALSPYTLVLTVPAGVLLALWHMNLLTDFHVHEGTLVRSLVRSLKMTMRGFLSFLLVAVLLLIVVAVILLVISVPTLVSSVISAEASFSLAMDDGADIPGYFNTIVFLFSAVGGFLTVIVSALLLSCWGMVYGAVSCRNSKKFQF